MGDGGRQTADRSEFVLYKVNRVRSLVEDLQPMYNY